MGPPIQYLIRKNVQGLIERTTADLNEVTVHVNQKVRASGTLAYIAQFAEAEITPYLDL